MIRCDRNSARARNGRTSGVLLLTLVLLLGAAFPAQAEDCVANYGGLLDGFAGTPAPSQLQIDGNCTIRNYPGGMSTNISFLTQPGQTDERWLVIFDNVVHTGQMSCNSVAGHKIWFVNGSSSGIHQNCQNLLIPVEKIDKQNPAGQTTAAIGVPFTYRLIIPVLFDPATGTVIDFEGSPNTLHGITVTDDLNATGVDLTYLSHTAYWLDGGAPIPHTFSNVGGVLTFDLFPIVPAGDQFIIEITVVLEDTPANAPGTQFINIAKWDFGRLIDDVFYEPLPGEWGITPPLTIAAPQLVVTKTGPATLGRTLNLGQWGNFAIDVQNTGQSDAWDVTILDRLPDGATGGMCDLTPQVLSAQVFAADGVTPVPGKGPLVPGTDFSLDYDGAPTCELTLTMLTAAGVIGPNERLIVTYRTQLDADSQNGATLTNVAGATEWFNGDSSNPNRVTFTRTLTDGTVGVIDHEDAHTVTVALFGYFFEKTVANLTSGANPTATAAAGDTLRYTLRLQSTDVPLDDLTFYDDLGALNASAVFVPGTLTLVSVPPGADATNTNPGGGTNGAGILDIRNLNVPANSEILVRFDITLDPTLTDGTVVLNQSDLISTVKIADSDDPNINGQADPEVIGDEDPTRVVIATVPVAPLQKENTQATATVGVPFSYRITVPTTPYAYPMYDVRITDDLTASDADLRFVGVSKISGSGPWTPVNTGTDTNLVIEDPSIGIDIPAGEQAVVEITVVLEDTPTNTAGLAFTNTADYTYNRVDEDDTSQQPGLPGTTPPMTIVEPGLTLEKSGPTQMTIGTPETFTLDVHNTSTTPAWNLTILDRLPDGATGGMCDAAPSAVTAQLFLAGGTPSTTLVQGTDFTVGFSGAPACEMTLDILSAAGTIGADQRLLVTYQTELDANTQDGVSLTNVAGATRWFSADSASAGRRTYTRTLTDGTVGVLDHQDAHTVGVALPAYFFEKTVANLTSGASPAITAAPGDTLRYTLRFQNTTAIPLADLAFFDDLDALNTPAAFQAGTLQLVTVPPGADSSNTSPTGGTKGTGVIDIRNLGLPAAGELLIVFDITLATTLADGTVVTNQSRLSSSGAPFALSDDPNVNGQADPFVAGDEDPTRVTVQSATAFRVEKVSTDLTGDPNILLAGETLRYTITVKNVGTVDAVDAALRDAVPANTQYVAGSTTLNGVAVPDGPGGTSPLAAGILIHAPENPTPGAMRADASATTSNVATIVFDVVVDPGVVDGTVISNQGFVSAPASGVSDEPSDDPGTPVADDPTRDVVVFAGALTISKTTPAVNVSRGQLVPYEITFTNQLDTDLSDLSIVDRVPAGFRYVEGSARIDGVRAEPTINGRDLVWADLAVGTGTSNRRSLLLLLAVGAGVGEGEYVNRAQIVSSVTGTPLSREASAKVRVLPDPTFSCTDALGKVFDDANRNGVQDAGERGLPGVRLVTARGLVATTDPYGRYHITCAVTPHDGRGSNFILKLDDRTLPSGYRTSTRQVQVQRATVGKALRLNFAASIHRLVSLDLADPVFEPGSTRMRPQWEPRLGVLLDELKKAPATLRLAYVADVEDDRLVDQRLRAVKKEITERWKALDAYPLAIETEVFWRRGGPPDRPASAPERSSWESLLPPVSAGPPVVEVDPGEAVERHLPGDPPPTRWAKDPNLLESEAGDRLEQREVLTDQAKTVKLKNVVPPIRFASGVADIPSSYVERLRGVLDGMRHLQNVRLHLVGHADDQALSGALAGVYGDNAGLSRERAGEVAEFLQRALTLPPEAISFAWAGDSQPIATNATAEGRALNRRVEVEVWYDEIEKKPALEDVVVPEEIKRVKVCRIETVCKLRYRDGHARRARVRNLIAPLHLAEEAVDLPEAFVRQVGEALHNLRDKQNVTVKFIGFTDDVPLSGRAERIYGTHLALSKARAHRVGLAIQEALALPSSAVASDGRGATQPLASNETERGRELNRRIEVEFWHDDPLQELPDEPQPCPDAADSELVTKVYDPPWGRIASLQLEGGEAVIPPGYADDLRRALADVRDKTNPRLRFVGYTSNERLDRRTAGVYGDDIGLSAARARRAMERIRAELGLPDSQAEHEGRGYVHSSDVVNAGFLQGDTSHVVVEVVYDELALLDDYEGVEITPITRELRVKDPLALNLMHISVDGVPIDDPGRSSADVQRCTDVALERADIRFRFDDLESGRRLSVTSEPASVPVRASAEEGARASTVRFRMYTNYPHFIERSEVRIFEREQSVQAEPLAVVAVAPDGFAEWQPGAEWFAAPVRELTYVLRAYDGEGRFDETAPQPLWVVHGDPVARVDEDPDAVPGDATPEAGEPPRQDELLGGYGESGPLASNIPLGSVGTVRVHGSDIPPQHTVWLAGNPVPVDEHGNFVAEAILPSGMHTVEVAVLDETGNGELFLRDVELERNDWFYVGMADLTMAWNRTHGPAGSLTGENAPYDYDSLADGRLAFFVNGKFGEDWKLRASADTRDGPVEDLFSTFLDKSPEALFRRMDPDHHYPTFGDDGTVEENAPTLGKFYVKLSQRENHAMWGNFKVGYLDNELAQVERGLYGANVHYQTLSTTGFGEERAVFDGFAAEPGTVPSREEFRGTGGSLYFLRRQDLLVGSDRVRIEVRDKDSGLVSSVVHLRPTLDYDIDYLQGRILLSEPLAATVDGELLVRSGGLSGDEAWLVVQYEYTPGFDEMDALATGGQGQYWLNDFVKFGLTANRNEEGDTDSSLYGADMTMRMSTESWFKLQAGRSEGLVSNSLRSDDGGFLFRDTGGLGLVEADANAYRADLSIAVSDVFEGGRGRLGLYAQKQDAGYSAAGLATLTDTDQFGGVFAMPVTDRMQLAAKADRRVQDGGLETTAQEVDLGYRLTERWSLSSGIRNELRKDKSPIVLLTQDEGERTDAVVQAAYDSRGRWRSYGFGQTTLAKSGDMEDNRRIGLGGAYRLSDRLFVDGEVSHGDFGPAGKLGTKYQQTDRTNMYLNYALGDERAYSGLHSRRGNLIAGARTRLSDSSSVYLENRYQHTDSTTGLTRAFGMSLVPADRWSLGGNWEFGTLIDRETHAETNRKAGGARLGYGFETVQLSSGVEYRFDETEQLDGTWTERTTWLFRNTLRYQVNPDGRVVGKFNHAFSDSSLGQFYGGGYTEAVLGYAYRPVKHDRLNALLKYTYFYNVPTTDQVTLYNTPVQFIQQSHVAALDLMYDLTPNWSVGGKYAYRLGQVSLDRENPDFFSNDAHLYILRNDWRFLKNWEGSLEGRMLQLPDLDERRSGALVTLYRYLGDHFKVGVGYNFTDFSEDLTDLSYDHHGLFFNLVGAM